MRFPAQYFNFAEFKKNLRWKKENLSRAEVQLVRREFAKEPPTISFARRVKMKNDAGEETTELKRVKARMTVYHFCKAMKLSPAGHIHRRVANYFKGPEGWKDFVALDKNELKRLLFLGRQQRRRLLYYITLFNHGLWPEREERDYRTVFAGRPYLEEGKVG